MTRRAPLLVALALLVVPAAGASGVDEPAGKIAFYRWTGDSDYSGAVWVMNADGSGQRRLTRNGQGGSPSWSPDGRRLAFEKAAAQAVWIMNADGSEQRLLRGAKGGSPAWSPDGRRIAFDGVGIWMVDANGGGRNRLSRAGFSPAWRPDGRTIAFVDQVEADDLESTEIFVMDADGRNQRRLTRNRVTDGSPRWSPSGRLIAFNRGDDIYVMKPDGRGARRLMRNGYDPTWSPDGRQIAFNRDFTIWVMNADGTGQHRISPSRGRGRHSLGAHSAPAWSPRG